MGGLFGGLSGILEKGLPLLSDPKDKTDIKELGTDKKTGLKMAAYRYKDDPKSYPKTVGPMAPKGSPTIGGHRMLFGLAGDAKRRS